MNKFAEIVNAYENRWSSLKDKVNELPGLIQYYWQEHTFGIVVLGFIFLFLSIIIFCLGYRMGNYGKLLKKVDKLFTGAKEILEEEK